MVRSEQTAGTSGVAGANIASAPDSSPKMGQTVLDLIAAQVARVPESTAVTLGAHALTYRQLAKRARQIAARLHGLDARPDSVVAILMERSTELVPALLGVLQAGCAYLALRPEDPQPRLEEQIRDAGVRIVVANAQLAARVPTGAATIVLGGSRLDAPVEAAPGLPSVQVTPEHLAYVAYTSGSTGAPKGVAVPHRAVTRLVEDPNWMCIRANDVFLQVSSASFDAATLEIFGALSHGCQLVMPPAGPLRLEVIAETMREHGVTVVNLVTGLLHQMIVHALPAFAGVRHVVTGGDIVSPALVGRLLDAHPGLLLTNGYGPTENTTFTTCWTTDAWPASKVPGEGAVPIGRPVNGTRIALLDSALCPVPDGTEGELYVSGAGLARGYLGRPAETAERFLPDPLGPAGSRMYRTGDLGHRLPGGDLGFAGRADRQVKIQGFRVEPGAVENALARRPGVAQAVVLVQEDDTGHKRLVGYVVPADAAGSADLGPRLREKLRTELPEYMVPWQILVRPELPLSHSGKVDANALASGRRPRNIPDEYIVPAAGTQTRVAGLWSKLLDIEPVGAHDDFFDLGGHSLLAAELLDAAYDEFGVEIPARTLYLQPTVAEFSAEVDQLLGQPSGDVPQAGGRQM